MKRILVLGAQGMMGHMLCRVLSPEHVVAGTIRGRRADDLFAPAFDSVQLITGVESSDLNSVRRSIDETTPEVVINCIGVVKQRETAAEAVPTIECNALFPHQLASLCGERNIRLLHLSTDCVFSGRAGPYAEDALPDPIDLYGRSKLLGELSEAEGLTIRTSIIGRQLSGSLSLVEWARTQRGNSVRGFRNAIFSGLTTEHLAWVISHLIGEHPDLTGLWHISAPPISKLDLLTGLNSRLDLDLDIVPVDLPMIDRSLISDRFWDTTGLRHPRWDDMLYSLGADEQFYQALELGSLSR
ncbi:MAG: dTDP-4-dehydrorhamnose reductase family protein [Acidimicrobiales bacterium]